MKRSKSHALWLDILYRVLKIPEPWTKKTEGVATSIMYDEFLRHNALDTGWYLHYEPWDDDGYWPYAVDPKGVRHDLRRLAGVIP